MAPPLGTLRIEVIEASGLYVKDSDGKDNAYAKVKVGDSKERTRVIKDSNSPVWDEEFSFAVKKLDESVKVEIFHHKKGSKDAFLGQYKFSVREVAERGEVDSWFTLQKRSKSSKVKGKVHLRLIWDGYQVPTDLFVFVREARNLVGTNKKSSLVTALRFGDYESQTQVVTGAAPKWDETIQFPWDEKAKDVLVEVRDDITGEKMASVKVSTKSIDDSMRRGQWFELKSVAKGGKANAPSEIFLKLSFDEGTKEEKKKMKRRGSSANLEPAMDIIGAAEQLEELPDMSEAGSDSGDDDQSDLEDSLSASGHFKKKKGFLDRFKAASEQGKIFLRDLEATIPGAPAAGQGKKGTQFVVEFVFEKQNLITEPKSGAAPKWKDSDFMFTIKEFTSELKVKIWEIPPGTADVVVATETKSNLIGTGKITLERLEKAIKFKDTFTVAISKLEKQNYSGAEIKCSVQFQPTVILDEEDFEEEKLPPDLQDSSPLGKLDVEVMAARDLTILDGKSTCDAFFTVDCQAQNYSSSPIPDNTSPEFAEIWTCDIYTLENSRLLVAIYDHDSKSGKDELLGAIKLPIQDLVDGREILKWFPLGRKEKMSTVSGDVQLKIKYTGKTPKRTGGGTRSRRNSEAGTSASDESSGLSRRKKGKEIDDDDGGSEDDGDRKKAGGDVSDLDDDDDDDADDDDEFAEQPDEVLGKVTIHIDEARDLKKAGSKLDSFASVRLADEKHKTKIVKGTTMPKWEDEAEFFVSDMLSDIEVSVWVVDKTGDQQFIGKATVGLETIADSAEVHEDWFPLKSDEKAKGKDTSKLQPAIHLKLQFKKREFKQKKPGQLFGRKAEIFDDDMKPDLLFKVILLGESGVGKTNLFTRIIHNSFEDGSKATLGVEFATKTYKVERTIVRVQLSDTAGQERFRSVSRQYYRGAMAGIIVYDITSLNSFNRVQSWIEEIRDHANNPLLHLLLLGNKVDLEELREVPMEKALELAKKYDMLFMECSAKNATNVARAFREILATIYEQAKTTGIQKISDNPFTVIDPSEDLDVVRLDGSKTIVISAEDAKYGEGVRPAGASSCRC